VRLLSCGYHAMVLAKGAAKTEIKRLASGVADNTTSLLDKQRARGVILL
jgi:hypothetical protein